MVTLIRRPLGLISDNLRSSLAPYIAQKTSGSDDAIDCKGLEMRSFLFSTTHRIQIQEGFTREKAPERNYDGSIGWNGPMTSFCSQITARNR